MFHFSFHIFHPTTDTKSRKFSRCSERSNFGFRDALTASSTALAVSDPPYYSEHFSLIQGAGVYESSGCAGALFHTSLSISFSTSPDLPRQRRLCRERAQARGSAAFLGNRPHSKPFGIFRAQSSTFLNGRQSQHGSPHLFQRSVLRRTS